MARSLASARTGFVSAIKSVGKYEKDCYAGATLHPLVGSCNLPPRFSLASSSRQLLRTKNAGFLGRHMNSTCNRTVLTGHTVKGRRHMSIRASTPATFQSAAKIGARETGTVPLEKLVEVVTKAAKIGAGVSLLCACSKLFRPASALINILRDVASSSVKNTSAAASTEFLQSHSPSECRRLSTSLRNAAFLSDTLPKRCSEAVSL